ncbi:hypothetical protein J4E91_005777 [Alternaria rosae]|nr:hypothetical protein J4E91_005777 [Alternaria rosae]
MEDITFGLNSVFAYSRGDEQAMDTKETQNGSTDKSTSPYASRARLKTLHDEERGLGESFGMVQYEDELTEDFEEVNRDIPTDFNGRVPN